MSISLETVDRHDGTVDPAATQRNFDTLKAQVPSFGGKGVEVRNSNGATAALVFAAATTSTVTVTHGLGRTPVCVVATPFGGTGQQVTLAVGSLTSTQFTLAATVPGALTGTIFAFWIAIG